MYITDKKLPTPPVSVFVIIFLLLPSPPNTAPPPHTQTVLNRGAIPDRTFTLGDYGEIPLVTVGDSAFPHFSWLIECYEKSKIKEHLYFNKIFFSARMVSENTYGILKGRWRFLHN